MAGLPEVYSPPRLCLPQRPAVLRHPVLPAATLFLVPKLYGKIEPLLGMQPRTPKTALEPLGPRLSWVASSVLLLQPAPRC